MHYDFANLSKQFGIPVSCFEEGDNGSVVTYVAGEQRVAVDSQRHDLRQKFTIVSPDTAMIAFLMLTSLSEAYNLNIPAQSMESILNAGFLPVEGWRIAYEKNLLNDKDDYRICNGLIEFFDERKDLQNSLHFKFYIPTEDITTENAAKFARWYFMDIGTFPNGLLDNVVRFLMSDEVFALLTAEKNQVILAKLISPGYCSPFQYAERLKIALPLLDLEDESIRSITQQSLFSPEYMSTPEDLFLNMDNSTISCYLESMFWVRFRGFNPDGSVQNFGELHSLHSLHTAITQDRKRLLKQNFYHDYALIRATATVVGKDISELSHRFSSEAIGHYYGELNWDKSIPVDWMLKCYKPSEDDMVPSFMK